MKDLADSRATLYRGYDALLEVKLTLQRLKSSTSQRRLHADYIALETSQAVLCSHEWLERAEALRLEVSDLYSRAVSEQVRV
jgi:hypothetical protein